MSKTFMVRKIRLQLLGVKMEKVMMTFYKIVIRIKIMSLINFPLVIHLVMTAVILVSFCTLILKKVIKMSLLCSLSLQKFYSIT